MGRQTRDRHQTHGGTMFGAVFLISTLAMVSSIPLKEMVCPQYTALDHPTFYPNPEDCGSYYMCDAGGTPVLMPCPSGLYWNSNLNVCDWPSTVECEESGESSSSEECEEGATDCELDSSSSSSSSSEEGEGEDKLVLALRKQ